MKYTFILLIFLCVSVTGCAILGNWELKLSTEEGAELDTPVFSASAKGLGQKPKVISVAKEPPVPMYKEIIAKTDIWLRNLIDNRPIPYGFCWTLIVVTIIFLTIRLVQLVVGGIKHATGPLLWIMFTLSGTWGGFVLWGYLSHRKGHYAGYWIDEKGWLYTIWEGVFGNLNADTEDFVTRIFGASIAIFLLSIILLVLHKIHKNKMYQKAIAHAKATAPPPVTTAPTAPSETEALLLKVVLNDYERLKEELRAIKAVSPSVLPPKPSLEKPAANILHRSPRNEPPTSLLTHVTQKYEQKQSGPESPRH